MTTRTQTATTVHNQTPASDSAPTAPTGARQWVGRTDIGTVLDFDLPTFLGPASGGETGPAAGVAVKFMAAGVALAGLFSGTTSTAPIVESDVRYLGSWTGTMRVLGGAVRTPSRSSAPALVPLGGAAEVPLLDTVLPATADVTEAPAATSAEEVRWLHEASGLTWEQLGRVFGVSRRAVHLWANGGRMNAVNAETLAAMVAVVRELPGRDADHRRTALLTPGSDGRSLIDGFRARQASGAGDITGTTLRPEQLLGALHDSPPDPT